jgi:glycyl-tRNA synthetase beta subunit
VESIQKGYYCYYFCKKRLVVDKLYKTIWALNDNDRCFLANHLSEGPADPRAAREAHNAAVKVLYEKSVALHTGDLLRAEIKQFASDVDRESTENIYDWVMSVNFLVSKIKDTQEKHAMIVGLYNEVQLWEAEEAMRKASIQAAQEKRAATLASRKRRKYVSVALRARLAKEYRKKLEWARSNGVALAILMDSRPPMTSDGSTTRRVPLTVA